MGPLQYVFLGARGQEQQDTIVRTLRSLSERGAIRVLDVVYAIKLEDGSIVPSRATTMTDEERQRYGALIGFGYGGTEGAKAGAQWGLERTQTPFAERELGESVFGESVQEIKAHLRDVAEDLPAGAACALALIEHRWMEQMREDLRKQGIVVLGTGMIRPRSLIMLGAALQTAEERRAEA